MPGHRFLIYIAASFVAFAIAFALPIPFEMIGTLPHFGPDQLKGPGAKTAMLGPSTVTAYSLCDADRRSITERVGAKTGLPMIDASNGGQPLEDSVQYAALIGKIGSVRTLVLNLNPLEFEDRNGYQVHEYYVFRVLNPGLAVDPFWRYFHGKPTMTGDLGNEFRPFDYKGKTYGGIGYFNSSVFPVEGKAQGCPDDRDAVSLETLAAATYMRQIRYPPDPANFDFVASLDATLKASGKRLIVALYPIDTVLLRQIDPTWPGIVNQRRKMIADGLERRGVYVIDMSEELPKSVFMGRWCGCTHLNERGRDYVASRIATALTSAPPPSLPLPDAAGPPEAVRPAQAAAPGTVAPKPAALAKPHPHPRAKRHSRPKAHAHRPKHHPHHRVHHKKHPHHAAKD